MSKAPAHEDPTMTAEEFAVWSEARPDGERYELVAGHPVRMQAEKVSHAERKLAATLAFRQALRQGGHRDCRAFVDGVGIRIASDKVREPDVVVHCGPYDPDDLIVPNPVIVVEVVSPSSVRNDVDRKLIDYFAVPSIRHYLIVYGEEGRVVHHRRQDDADAIITTILGRESTLELDPPGISVSVDSFWDD